MCSQPTTRLRALEKGDLPTLLNWRNTDSIRKWMRNSHLITTEEHILWWDGLLKDKSRIALIFEANCIASGFIQFAQENESPKTFSWGFYASPYAPKGTGRLMCSKAISFAFEQLDCEVLCGQCVPGNMASIGLHLGLGFCQVQGGEQGMVNFVLTRSTFDCIRHPPLNIFSTTFR